MPLTITLDSLDESRLAELRALYERCGRTWHGDGFMARYVFERGMREELDDARFLATIFGESPELRRPEGEP